MALNSTRPRYLHQLIGSPHDPPAADPDSAATVISLLKGWLAQLPATAPDPPVPHRHRNRVRGPTAAFGSPGDPMATSTTAPSTAISLLKGILHNLSRS